MDIFIFSGSLTFTKNVRLSDKFRQHCNKIKHSALRLHVQLHIHQSRITFNVRICIKWPYIFVSRGIFFLIVFVVKIPSLPSYAFRHGCKPCTRPKVNQAEGSAAVRWPDLNSKLNFALKCLEKSIFRFRSSRSNSIPYWLQIRLLSSMTFDLVQVLQQCWLPVVSKFVGPVGQSDISYECPTKNVGVPDQMSDRNYKKNHQFDRWKEAEHKWPYRSTIRFYVISLFL